MTRPVGVEPIEPVEVLVVGTGVAGMMSALELASAGVRVGLLSPGAGDEGSSWVAQGGVAAAMASDDDPDAHAADTLVAGAGLCNPDAVAVLTREGPAAVRRAIAHGVVFDRDAAGDYRLTREGAHGRSRILHAGGDATGHEMSRALLAAVRRNAGVRLMLGWQVVELLGPDGWPLAMSPGATVAGALVCDGAGAVAVWPAGAVVLATGGLGALFHRSTNPPTVRGDGMALAWLAGAALVDLEFIQFHPTALAVAGGPAFLLSEALRGEGAHLIDGAGHRFMSRVHPLAELAPRDVVARGVDAVRLRGEGPVRLDARHLGRERLAGRFPTVASTLARLGFDLAAQPIPVSPAAHYTMGGIGTDLDGRTAVPGLFAVGEVASTGVHGANRLASNSLLECLVFARRVAAAVVRDGPRLPAGGVCRCAAPVMLEHPAITVRTLPPLAGLDRPLAWFGEALADHLGIWRQPERLAAMAEAVEPITALAPDAWSIIDWPADPLDRLARRHALICAAVMARCALRRRESRGAHWREDHPDPEPRWCCRQSVRGAQLSDLPMGSAGQSVGR